MSWFTKKKNPNETIEEAARADSAVSGVPGAKTGTSAGALGSAVSGSGNWSAGVTDNKSSSVGSGATTVSAPQATAASGAGYIAPEPSAIERRFGKLRSALGPGTEVQGRLSFDSAVSLDGVLKGTIRSTELIVVSRLGRVEATSLLAKALVIEGEVSGGDITVSERLEVLAGGKFIGSVNTPLIVVEEGGIFDGVCHITSADEAANRAIPPMSAPQRPTSNQTSNNPSNQSVTAPGSSSALNRQVKTGVNASPDNSLEAKPAKKKISVEELIGK